MKCPHENFKCDCGVNRITAEEGGPVAYYSADITMKCSDCGQKFEFVGLPVGHSPYRPTMTLDCLKVSIPMIEENGKIPAGMPSVFARMAEEQN